MMFHHIFRRFVLLGLALALSACAVRNPSRVADAATAPLNDLNLVYAEIPAVLLEAQKQAYAMPADPSCAALSAAIGELDVALGPDLDAPATESDPGLIERGSDEVQSSAIGALRSTTESIVPFRGWIRRLSGAESYSKKVAASIAAGTIRRAFLKGLRVSKGCALNSSGQPQP